MFKKNRSYNRKNGFTLVEVIVVLVILAILAAILVPKLIGWIDQSKEKEALLRFSLMEKAMAAAALEVSDISTVDSMWIMYGAEPVTPEGDSSLSAEQKQFSDQIKAYLDPDFPPTEINDTTYMILIPALDSSEEATSANLIKHTEFNYMPKGYQADTIKYTYKDGKISSSIMTDE